MERICTQSTPMRIERAIQPGRRAFGSQGLYQEPHPPQLSFGRLTLGLNQFISH